MADGLDLDALSGYLAPFSAGQQSSRSWRDRIRARALAAPSSSTAASPT